ncbi:hypothetical protein Dimus_011349 [Dionaea muscipula]
MVNLPRVMMRLISYVISMKDHELPYGDWLTMVFEAFGVPLDDKQGEEPKRYDFFEETFLTICQLTRENGVWWLVDKATDQGESGSDDKFYDAQVDVEEPVAEAPAVPAFSASPSDSSNQQKEAAGVDPSGPSSHIPDSVMSKLQANFERARANRIQADLKKAQAENARLLNLLQQAQS